MFPSPNAHFWSGRLHHHRHICGEYNGSSSGGWLGRAGRCTDATQRRRLIASLPTPLYVRGNAEGGLKNWPQSCTPEKEEGGEKDEEGE